MGSPGGGLSARDSGTAVSVLGCSFQSYFADGYGGGAGVQNGGCSLDIAASTFDGCSCGQWGGTLSCSGARLTVRQDTVISNGYSSWDGGGFAYYGACGFCPPFCLGPYARNGT